MPTEAADKKGEHQNVARVALVLDVLKGSGEQGLRLTDVVERSGLSVSVIHRLLNGLVAHGLVDSDEAANRYFVGLKMIGWTASAIGRYGLAPFASEVQQQLAEDTGDTVYFSLITNKVAVCVDRYIGSFPIRTLTLNVGDQRPLGVGSGSLALLAFQTETFIDDILTAGKPDRASYGIEDDWLKPALARSRDLGFALNEGKLIKGMSGVAVPVCKSDGTAVAALTVAAISDRLSGDRLETVVEKLKAGARSIEQSAGDIMNSPIIKRHARQNG